MLIFDQLRKNDRHLRALAASVLSGMIVLFLGLWYVQVLSAKRYRNSQVNQSLRTVRIPAIRGKIFDANGVALAENRPSYNVTLYLEELRKNFQDAYASTIEGLYQKRISSADRQSGRKLNKGERRKLFPPYAERVQIGREVRHRVVSNLVFRATSALHEPVQLAEEQFLKHYGQRLFVPMPVLSDLNPQQIALFIERDSDMPGFDLDVQPLRIYPHHAAAAHIIGRLQRDDAPDDEDTYFNYRMPDFRGVFGIEKTFGEELRGKTGVKSVLVNSLNYRQSENVWTPAEAGENVFLTIDLSIQQAAEKALRTAVEGANTRGAVVVMDPRNGDLLAVASNPSFDPNDFIPGISTQEYEKLLDTRLKPMRNRATQEIYAPGSVFKIVVGLAGLEAGTLDPGAIYYSKGYYELGRRRIADLASAGEYDFRRALIKSSNSYFIYEGLRAGVDRILEIGKRLHFGEPTGVPTLQDEKGIFPTREWRREHLGGWSDGDTANLCIGQGYLAVTPLQVAVMISAIANGGTVFWPRLVARVEPQDPFSEEQPVAYPTARVRDRLGVGQHILQLVRDAMRGDVEDAEGTGKRAFVPGMGICAKTGTAQIQQGRKTVGHTVWFASFAPYEAPRYVVVVMVELDVDFRGTGGETCAPIAHQVYLALQKREQQQRQQLARNESPARK